MSNLIWIPCPHGHGSKNNNPRLCLHRPPMEYTVPKVRWYKARAGVRHGHELRWRQTAHDSYAPAFSRTLVAEDPNPAPSHHRVLVRYEGHVRTVYEGHWSTTYVARRGAPRYQIREISIHPVKHSWAAPYALFDPKTRRIQVFMWISLTMNIEDHKLYKDQCSRVPLYKDDNVVEWLWRRTHCNIWFQEFGDPITSYTHDTTGESMEAEQRTYLVVKAVSLMQGL